MKYVVILILFFTMIFNFNAYAEQGDEKIFAGWILIGSSHGSDRGWEVTNTETAQVRQAGRWGRHV